MRFIFLIGDLESPGSAWWRLQKVIDAWRLYSLKRRLLLRFMRMEEVFGGTLNLMRHCAVARNCGADAVLATARGRNTYGDRAAANLPFIRWQDRRDDDICIVPDLFTALIDQVTGPVIAYIQSPNFINADFDYRNERVMIWTDSPFMQEKCEAVYSGKEIHIVPNIIDDRQFPFIPQSEREPGLIFAFPRKGPEYIDETERLYREAGGSYWKIERISGLTIHELAQAFRRPQVFLASAEVEGCALPPQESMASGIVVVGKTAKGANFCMEDRETAMIAETPADAVRCLIELENPELRDLLTQNAHRAIKHYFPSQEPTAFWRRTIQRYSDRLQLV
jgi:glycosyltransferase involved in cell wall biosynthesis